MSHKEYLENQAETMGSEAPLLGAAGGRPTNPEFSTNRPDGLIAKARYFSANMSDHSDLLFMEELMTRSLRSAGELTNEGDLVILAESTNFSRDGEYCVLVKYLELMNNQGSSQLRKAEDERRKKAEQAVVDAQKTVEDNDKPDDDPSDEVEIAMDVPEGILPSHDF